jgi:hypothetical protein
MTPCPTCQKPLHRVHRKPLERTLSYVVPVQRFICYNHACRWQGLRVVWKAHPFLANSNKQNPGKDNQKAS